MDDTDSKYAPLQAVLGAAYEQAANGKGRERHAKDKPFLEQTIFQTAEAHGLGFLTGQAEKKTREALGLLAAKGPEAAERELLGAVVYLAAAVIVVRQKADEAKTSVVPVAGTPSGEILPEATPEAPAS